jgi:hypothetical protein
MSPSATVSGANLVQPFTIETTILVSTAFLSNVNARRRRLLPARPKRAGITLFPKNF